MKLFLPIILLLAMLSGCAEYYERPYHFYEPTHSDGRYHGHHDHGRHKGHHGHHGRD